MSECNSYRVMIERKGQQFCIGGVSRNPLGWQFIPFYQASPSRKRWPTAEAALKGRVKDYALVPSVPKAPQ